MRVRILGPLEVVAAGEPFAIGGARLRTLLIRLALDAGRTVTVDALSDALWPEHGPADPANALQSLVSRLRRALPAELAVRSVSGGYCLDVAPDEVDALRFERPVRDRSHRTAVRAAAGRDRAPRRGRAPDVGGAVPSGG